MCRKKREEEELVKGGRVVQMPRCLQYKYLYGGRGGCEGGKRGERKRERMRGGVEK